jgi:hypothetical protein
MRQISPGEQILFSRSGTFHQGTVTACAHCPDGLFQMHIGQRISEFLSAIATHLIGSAADGENAAQVAMVATKEEIQNDYQPLHKVLLCIRSRACPAQFDR